MVHGTSTISVSGKSSDPRVKVTEDPKHTKSSEVEMVAGGNVASNVEACTAPERLAQIRSATAAQALPPMGRNALKRLQVNREFIQVGNVQSSKLRRRAHAEGLPFGELPTRRGEIEVLNNMTLFK